MTMMMAMMMTMMIIFWNNKQQSTQGVETAQHSAVKAARLHEGSSPVQQTGKAAMAVSNTATAQANKDIFPWKTNKQLVALAISNIITKPARQHAAASGTTSSKKIPKFQWSNVANSQQHKLTANGSTSRSITATIKASWSKTNQQSTSSNGSLDDRSKQEAIAMTKFCGSCEWQW